MRTVVIGAGQFGTVFTQLLCDAGREVTLWTNNPAQAEAINTTRHNPASASEVELPEAVVATTDLAGALAQAELIVVALPSQVVRDALAPYRESVPRHAVVLSLMKGVEHGTDARMSQVLTDIWDWSPSGSRCYPDRTSPWRSRGGNPRRPWWRVRARPRRCAWQPPSRRPTSACSPPPM